VLLAVGDHDATRALRDAHGLTAPTLLRPLDVDPFRGTGTPAAYLVDADGLLAEGMVVGAEQVPMLARDLAGLDPAVPFGREVDVDLDHALDGEQVRGTYLPAPGAMCGAGGGGGSAANSTTWHGTRAYALGGFHVGLRHDGPATAETLDRLFPGARVNDRRVPDNYSVALGAGASGNGSARSLHLLVHGSRQLVRSRSRARVLAALLQHLAAGLAPEVDTSLTQIGATPVLYDGQALLLPHGLLDHLKQLQPRLAKEGMTIVDTPRTLVDLTSRELVVPEPVVDFDPAVLDEVDADARLGNELPWTRPGCYPVRAWFLTRNPDQLGRFTPAVAAASALALLMTPTELRAGIEQLGSFFGEVDAYGIWYGNEAELVDAVASALR